MEELYEAEIMTFDHEFGRFIDYLKQRGIYKQSLIVFLSDHGEEFFEHRGWSHGHSLYNELIKVPLIIKFPQGKYKGKKIEKNVGLIDVLPTLTDYLDIEQQRQIDGISLMPLIAGGHFPVRRLISSSAGCLFFDSTPKRIAILFDRYKVIYNFPVSAGDKDVFREAGLPPEPPMFEVFDLEKDPRETHNLYPGSKTLVNDLQKELKDIIKRVRLHLKRSKSPKIEFSSEELERLKSLGYIE